MKIHIVKSGETLSQIAEKYGVTLEKIIEVNPIIADPNDIDVGLKVKIPLNPIKVQLKVDDAVKEKDAVTENLGSFYDLPDFEDNSFLQPFQSPAASCPSDCKSCQPGLSAANTANTAAAKYPGIENPFQTKAMPAEHVHGLPNDWASTPYAPGMMTNQLPVQFDPPFGTPVNPYHAMPYGSYGTNSSYGLPAHPTWSEAPWSAPSWMIPSTQPTDMENLQYEASSNPAPYKSSKKKATKAKTRSKAKKSVLVDPVDRHHDSVPWINAQN